MLSRVDISLIIKAHINTFKQANGQISWKDALTFALLPNLFGISLIYCLNYKIDNNAVSILITSLSIFAALLFNLLLLLYDLAQKERNRAINIGNTYANADHKFRMRFLSHIHSNVSFTIVVSLLCVILLFTLSFAFLGEYMLQLIQSLIIILVTIFLLTLFMILKRMFRLLNREFTPGD